MAPWYPAAGPSGIEPSPFEFVAVGLPSYAAHSSRRRSGSPSPLRNIMDRTDAHVCGIAAVRSSPVATALVGMPVEQQGFTGGSTSSQNGELTSGLRLPSKARADLPTVVSDGHCSRIASRLAFVFESRILPVRPFTRPSTAPSSIDR